MTTIDTSTEAVERLLDGVTPGPWRYDDNDLFETIRDAGGTSIIHGGRDGDLVASGADARFIAAARNLVPALMKERDDLRAKLTRFEAMSMLDFANYLTAKSLAKIKGATHE